MVEIHYKGEVLWKTGDKKIISLSNLDLEQFTQSIKEKFPDVEVTDTEGSVSYDFGEDGIFSLGKVMS